MTYRIRFPTTDDRVLDTILALALADLTIRIDPHAHLKLALGRPVFLEIRSKLSEKKLGERVRKELKNAMTSFTLAERLAFRLNVGNMPWQVDPNICFQCIGKGEKCNRRGNCGRIVIPAYAVFCGNVEMTIKYEQFCWDVEPLRKVRGDLKDYSTIYVGLSPYWSKGLRRWDAAWLQPSTYAPRPIPSLLYYGLAYYAITMSVKKPQNTFTQILFSPPLGMELSHSETVQVVKLIKRIINIAELETRAIIRAGLPILIFPLALVGQLDLPAIHELVRVAPSIILTSYDLDRGYPKNPRGYEELNTMEILEFYERLGRFFWSFRSMLRDLTKTVRRTKLEKFRTRIFDILMDLTMSIKNRDIYRFNDALLKVQSLNKEELSPKIHFLRHEEVLAVQSAIRAP